MSFTTPDPRAEERRRFRRTLVRVLAVQVVTVFLLWLIEATWTR